MPVALAYTSDVSCSRKGWDSFDRLVLWAASQQPGGTFDDVFRLVPDGIHLRLVATTLRYLVEAGELEQGRAVANGWITATYTATSAGSARKAA